MVEMFEARPTDQGWSVWENGVQRWAARQDLSESAALAIAQYLNEHRTAVPRRSEPSPKRPSSKPALIKVGSDWLTCEIHEWLRTPGTRRWEAKVVVWVDQDYLRPVDPPTMRGRRGGAGAA